MRLRALVLTGLLGTTAMMMTGCLEDTVDDLANILDIKTGSVVLFNDFDAITEVTVNGETKTLSGHNILGQSVSVVTEDDHAIRIDYSGASTTPDIQNNGTTYVYATSGSCSNGYVLDVVGSEKLRVMNLSGRSIANADLNISRNGVKIDLPTAAADCAVTAAYTGATDGDWSVQYKGVDLLGVGSYPSSSTDIKVEIVIYDVTSGSEAGGMALISELSI